MSSWLHIEVPVSKSFSAQLLSQRRERKWGSTPSETRRRHLSLSDFTNGWVMYLVNCAFVQFVPIVALFVYFHFRWWEEWACKDHPWFYRIFSGPKHQSLECRFVGLDLKLPCNMLFYLKTALYNLRPSGNTWVVKLRPLSFQLYQWQFMPYIRDRSHKRLALAKDIRQIKKGVRVYVGIQIILAHTGCAI